MLIRIIDYHPTGLQVALYNEAGLDHGALKREAELEEFYAFTSQAFEGCTVYAVALQQREMGAEAFAKAYIDYTPDNPAEALARLAAYLVSKPDLPDGLVCRYYTERNIIHIGVWVACKPDRETVRRWNRLWKAVG